MTEHLQMSDEELVERARDGDAAAFEELFHRYQGGVYRFLMHLAWDPPKAEDGVQEVFLRLWRALPVSVTRGREVSGYVFAIARNWWFDQARKNGREVPLAPGQMLDPAAEPGPGLAPGVADEVRCAVDELPELQRTALVMTKFMGLKNREVAQILGVPEGTVESRVSLAYKRLRVRLAHCLAHR